MLEQVSQLAREAGMAIMKVYQQSEPIQVQEKSDNSPVTAADLVAHQIIKQGLSALTPEIPQLSEEDPPAWE
ncbi:3'(2'),5'-bisphosphate nucleotidase CysQ, partial [Pseudomonas aeruginosa]